VEYIDKVWHQYLKRPYKLALKTDIGNGQPVVFLHGIAAKSESWAPVIDKLNAHKYRIVSFDLLGFGVSPNPNWLEYSVDDHAKSVIASIRQRRIKGPIILVGHSMGAVIAARIARLKPKLVKHLILYQIPVYSDNPDLGVKDMRNKAYLSFLNSLADNQKLTLRSARMIEKIASRAIRFTLSEDNWPAFERSLRNTVLRDDVFEDVRALKIPTDIIYGSYDPLILRRSMRRAFKNSSLIKFNRVDETHRISKRAGALISTLIEGK
jgi:cis-3-alkyl-4-acyloxetan-2-one decarboxylase